MSEFEKFIEWATENLGQGYGLEMDEGSFVDKVTRWAFVAYKAGLKDGNVSGLKEIGHIGAAHGDPEAFGEREVYVSEDIQKFPYNTKIYVKAKEQK